MTDVLTPAPAPTGAAEPAEPALDPEAERAARRAQTKSDLRLGAVFLMWFMFVVTGIYSGYKEWNAAPAGTEDLSLITSEIFGTRTGADAMNWLAPFEVLSVLLLAALIAAIVLALREGSE